MVRENVKEYMAEKGIKQKSIAEKIGMNPNSFSAMLSGKRKLYVDEYIVICKALEVDPAQLLKGETT